MFFFFLFLIYIFLFRLVCGLLLNVFYSFVQGVNHGAMTGRKEIRLLDIARSVVLMYAYIPIYKSFIYSCKFQGVQREGS
ncbi:hypothetical protein BDV39DRAFT_173530 [Aspergillus sergii]|uniref:Uncharacterized protein n=1 Tax=Aspergillus sergii TaxID=1034303 RepID=A0A5N6XAQ0_9EURO|nr:hypothetical protein BDV39DRAFT_173530 [Aspergillus sergii]